MSEVWESCTYSSQMRLLGETPYMYIFTFLPLIFYFLVNFCFIKSFLASSLTIAEGTELGTETEKYEVESGDFE